MSRRTPNRATSRVDAKLVTTAAQRFSKRHRELMALAKEHAERGNNFQAERLRVQAREALNHSRQAKAVEQGGGEYRPSGKNPKTRAVDVVAVTCGQFNRKGEYKPAQVFEHPKVITACWSEGVKLPNPEQRYV